MRKLRKLSGLPYQMQGPVGEKELYLLHIAGAKVTPDYLPWCSFCAVIDCLVNIEVLKAQAMDDKPVIKD